MRGAVSTIVEKIQSPPKFLKIISVRVKKACVPVTQPIVV